jgi:predicted RNase H-like nuclease (RuvC/YqgF family)
MAFYPSSLLTKQGSKFCPPPSYEEQFEEIEDFLKDAETNLKEHQKKVEAAKATTISDLIRQLDDLRQEVCDKTRALKAAETRLVASKVTEGYLEEQVAGLRSHYDYLNNLEEQRREAMEHQHDMLTRLTAQIQHQAEFSDTLLRLASDQHTKADELQKQVREEQAMNEELRAEIGRLKKPKATRTVGTMVDASLENRSIHNTESVHKDNALRTEWL